MPWDIRKRGSQHCVVKQGESTPVPGGCHATRAEAIRHQRALYAGEAHGLLDAIEATARKRRKGGMKLPYTTSASEFAGISPHSTPMVDRPWDGPSQVAKLPNPVGRAKARQMYAWVDSNKDQNVKASYHFPHHEVSASGEVGPANMAGVRIGLSRVPRANIPESERAGARAHLQRHLQDWHRKQGTGVEQGGEMDAEHVEIATIEDGDGNVIGFWSPGLNATMNTSGTAATINTPSFKWTLNGDEVNPDELLDTFRLNEIPAESVDDPTWEGVLAVEGLATSDGRYLMPGKIGHRDLPLTLMAQKVTDEGHKGAEVAGKITEITRVARPDLGENAVAIIGKGVFADTSEGREAAQLLADEVLRGVSIDFAATATHMLDPETLEIIDGDDMELADLLGGKFLRGFEGDIMGATLCPFPAFEDATMQIVETPEKVVVACAFPVKKVLTASAAGIAPLKPPYDWFFTPETNGPCPLTVTDDGRVYGHLALWNQCHRSASMSCEMAPRSRSGYAYFHTGALATADGEKVNVGRITVGDGGHASVSPWLGTEGAVKHYDETGMVGAFVRATDGNYGVWLSGVVRSDCPAEKVRDMEANPPSGDWREENGRLELCAALSVPVAGFPVPRYEAALVASGMEERVVALVASGYSEPEALSRATQRRLELLQQSARAWLADEWDDGFATISARERRRAAGTGAALPDGSFPIRNCSDASNAIRAQGRAAPEKRGRVRAHIRRRVRSLGCSGGIFDPYK